MSKQSEYLKKLKEEAERRESPQVSMSSTTGGYTEPSMKPIDTYQPTISGMKPMKGATAALGSLQQTVGMKQQQSAPEAMPGDFIGQTASAVGAGALNLIEQPLSGIENIVGGVADYGTGIAGWIGDWGRALGSQVTTGQVPQDVWDSLNANMNRAMGQGGPRIIKGVSQITPGSLAVGTAMKMAEKTSLTKPLAEGFQGAIAGGQGFIGDVAARVSSPTGTDEERAIIKEKWMEQVSPVIGDIASVMGLRAMKNTLSTTPSLAKIAKVVDKIDSIGMLPLSVAAKTVNNFGGGIVHKLTSLSGVDMPDSTLAGMIRNISGGKVQIRDKGMVDTMQKLIDNTPAVKNMVDYAGKFFGQAGNVASRSYKWVEDQANSLFTTKYGFQNIDDERVTTDLQNAQYTGMFDTAMQKTREFGTKMVQDFNTLVSGIYEKAGSLQEKIPALTKASDDVRKGIYDNLHSGVLSMKAKVGAVKDAVSPYLSKVDAAGMPAKVSNAIKGVARGIVSDGSIGFLKKQVDDLDALILDKDAVGYRDTISTIRASVQDALDDTLGTLDTGIKQILDETKNVESRAEAPIQQEFFREFRDKYGSEEGLQELGKQFANVFTPRGVNNLMKNLPSDIQEMISALGDEANGLMLDILQTSKTNKDYAEYKKTGVDPSDMSDMDSLVDDNPFFSLAGTVKEKAPEWGITARSIVNRFKNPKELITQVVKGDSTQRKVLAKEIGLPTYGHIDNIQYAKKDTVEQFEKMNELAAPLVGETVTPAFRNTPQSVVADEIVSQIKKIEKLRSVAGEEVQSAYDAAKDLVLDVPDVSQDIRSKIEDTFKVKISKKGVIEGFQDSTLRNSPESTIGIIQNIMKEVSTLSEKKQVSLEEYDTWMKGVDAITSSKTYIDSIELGSAIDRDIRSLVTFAESKIKPREGFLQGADTAKRLFAEYSFAKNEYRQIMDIQRSLSAVLIPGKKSDKTKIQNLDTMSPENLEVLMQKSLSVLGRLKGRASSTVSGSLGLMNKKLHQYGLVSDPRNLIRLHDYLETIVGEVFENKYEQSWLSQEGALKDKDIDFSLFSTSAPRKIIQKLATRNPDVSRALVTEYVKARRRWLEKGQYAVKNGIFEEKGPTVKDSFGNTLQTDDYVPEEDMTPSQAVGMEETDVQQRNMNDELNP